MTTQAEALDRLIAAVDAGNADDSPKGEWPLRRFLEAFPGSSGEYIRAADAYRGSLDAAKALHDALLPGWGFSVHEDSAEVEDDHAVGPFYDHIGGDPARAWLLAILRAYRGTLE
ncbi:hypothetical protein [Neotabrizicola sp. sgz301269]|uniref:hypothetical protein n=1 Tax=Neotabrizicola sp. sgz301269 TaxID=3276282 RepID=UPI003770567E